MALWCPQPILMKMGKTAADEIKSLLSFLSTGKSIKLPAAATKELLGQTLSHSESQPVGFAVVFGR